MQPGAIVSMIMVGIGCLVPAMVNIVWRAIHGLSFLGIDNKQPEKNVSKKPDSTDNKPDE
ncbi:Protein of uncharacterised function (DUF1418) [Providencia rettgeri]|nr:Protein of uncharacterised function (DUF1418) [Providencia rettgeri]